MNERETHKINDETKWGFCFFWISSSGVKSKLYFLKWPSFSLDHVSCNVDDCKDTYCRETQVDTADSEFSHNA